MRSLKKVNPPETSSVFSPAAWQAPTKVSTPGLSRRRFAYTSSSACTGTPRSSARRRRRLCR